MKYKKGQIMLLTVILISGAILSSTALAGLLIIYQLRQATDVAGSMRAIFAADTGIEWAFYNEMQPPASRESYPKIINLTNGAKATITYDSSDPLPIKAIGQYGRSARAFQANSPACCEVTYDVMLVLDRSGSISNSELALLKDAANIFVDALSPSSSGSHVGVTSFASSGTLDEHLTDNGAVVKASINALSNGGSTDLSEGIDLANGELNDRHIPHERPEIDDVMIIITDGDPNVPGGVTSARQVAENRAKEARRDDVEVYVVGVGVTPSTEDYLIDEIVNDVAYYFPVSDYSELEGVLQAVAQALLSKREVLP